MTEPFRPNHDTITWYQWISLYVKYSKQVFFESDNYSGVSVVLHSFEQSNYSSYSTRFPVSRWAVGSRSRDKARWAKWDRRRQSIFSVIDQATICIMLFVNTVDKKLSGNWYIEYQRVHVPLFMDTHKYTPNDQEDVLCWFCESFHFLFSWASIALSLCLCQTPTHTHTLHCWKKQVQETTFIRNSTPQVLSCCICICKAEHIQSAKAKISGLWLPIT